MIRTITRAICAVILMLCVSVPLWAASGDTDPASKAALADTIDSLKKKIESEDKTRKSETKPQEEESQPTADTARKAEQQYQSELQEVARSVDNLETRVADYRRLIVPPTKTDIDRLNRDLDLTEKALGSLAVPSQSPLSQLQKAELLDRLFELHLAVGIMTRRWGDGLKVFGSDFFANATTTETPEPPVVPDSYVIRSGDKLEVAAVSSVGERSEYELRVDGSGCVAVPGVGKVRAVGKTVAHLRDELSNRLRSKFKQLNADVTVINTRPIRVQVTGEVAKPNTYSIAGMATVLSALYQAGGPTKSGSYRKVALVRAGQPRRAIDLYKFLMQGDKSQDYPLQEGDLIFVPPVGGTVTIEGEVIRPGRYEPDFPLTLAQALKLAGGPAPGGYLQSVQVERVVGGEYRELLDPGAHDGARNDFAIKPGDQITLRPLRPDRTSQVEVVGPVGAPGLYGFTPGMRVSDLIRSAQGLAHDREVYGGRADILRTDPLNGAELITVDLDKALQGDKEQNVELQKLDRLFVYEPEQVVYRPRVMTVLGAVMKQGTYPRPHGASVSDAVAAAGGVSPDAYLKRADLVRRKADGTKELIRIDLEKALSRLPGEDVKLEDRDTLTIYTDREAEWKDRTVRVEGAVQRPGVYERLDGMRVSDLLTMSGGLLPEAAKSAEVGRWTVDGESQITKVDLGGLVAGSDQDIVLRDRDVLTVAQLNPALRAPEIVFLKGEVARPGPYTLRKDEKLVDLIQRAGGLTGCADTRGLMFLRQKEILENSQQSKDVDMLLQKCRVFADKQFVMSLAKLGMPLPAQYVEAVQKTAEKLSKPVEVAPEEGSSTEKLSNDEGAQQEGGTSTSTSSQSGTQKLSNEQQVQTQSDEQLKAEQRKTEQEQTAKANRPELLEKLRTEPTPREIETQSALGPRIMETLDLEELDLSVFKGRQDLAELATSARISVDLQRAMRDESSPDNIPLRSGDSILIPRITNVVSVYGAVLHPHAFAAGAGESVSHFIERSGGFAQDAAKGSVVVVRSNGDAIPMNRARTVEPGDTIVVPTTGLIDIAKKWDRMSPVTKVISDVLSSVYILTRF